MARKRKSPPGWPIESIESYNFRETRGVKVGDTRTQIDWRKEFGIEGFALPTRNVMLLCEDIYQARFRQLKYSEEVCAAELMARTNDAIVAARAELDECPVYRTV